MELNTKNIICSFCETKPATLKCLTCSTENEKSKYFCYKCEENNHEKYNKSHRKIFLHQQPKSPMSSYTNLNYSNSADLIKQDIYSLKNIENSNEKPSFSKKIQKEEEFEEENLVEKLMEYNKAIEGFKMLVNENENINLKKLEKLKKELNEIKSEISFTNANPENIENSNEKKNYISPNKYFDLKSEIEILPKKEIYLNEESLYDKNIDLEKIKVSNIN